MASKPELVIADTLKDKHGRTVKVGHRGGDVEIIVTPHSGAGARIFLDGRGRDRFIRAWAEAERQAEVVEAEIWCGLPGGCVRGPGDHLFDSSCQSAPIAPPASGMSKVERLARDLVGIPDAL
jgi:hypothetical protein